MSSTSACRWSMRTLVILLKQQLAELDKLQPQPAPRGAADGYREDAQDRLRLRRGLPWCAIGLASLEIALKRLQDEVAAELPPSSPRAASGHGAEGRGGRAYLAKKYGMSAEQVERNQQSIAERGKAVGFEFRMERRSRTWNTFDAHRLLHWAGEVGAAQQRAQARAALPSPRARTLARARCCCAAPPGPGWMRRAPLVVDGDEYADAVREREQLYQQAGISSVPSVIVNERYLIQGGQPPGAVRAVAARDRGRSLMRVLIVGTIPSSATRSPPACASCSTWWTGSRDGARRMWPAGRALRRRGARPQPARRRRHALAAPVARRGRDMPVLILTARDGVADRVAGLDAGADDYPRQAHHHRRTRRAAACFKWRSTGARRACGATARSADRPAAACAGTTSRWS